MSLHCFHGKVLPDCTLGRVHKYIGGGLGKMEGDPKSFEFLENMCSGNGTSALLSSTEGGCSG